MKIILNKIVFLFLLSTIPITGFASTPADEISFNESSNQIADIFESFHHDINQKNMDALTVAMATALLTKALTDEEFFSMLQTEDGKLVLTEEAALYGLGALKDKVKGLAIGAINLGLDIYDKAQAELEDKIPGFREKLAEVLGIINQKLSTLDPEKIGKAINLLGGVLGVAASWVGAAFGVPMVPGLVIKASTKILSSPRTISGVVASAQTLLDIAEEIARVKPDAKPQTDEEKGKAIQKLVEALKFVTGAFIENYSQFKPKDVEFIKGAIQKATGVFALFA